MTVVDGGDGGVDGSFDVRDRPPIEGGTDTAGDRTPPVAVTVAGTIHGAGGAGVKLRLNAGELLTPAGDGPFSFPDKLDDNSPYTVTVEGSPEGRLCHVLNATGTVTPALQLTVICLGAVEPRFPSASNWMDYVKATDTTKPCEGNEPGNYYACLHGGEKRTLPLPGITSCTGITAADELGAFEWVCDASASPVRVRSIALQPDKGLTDLIDFQGTPPALRPNRVVVTITAGTLRSPSTVWWSNPLVVTTKGETLDVAGTIYVATRSVVGQYTTTAPKVALAMAPGTNVSFTPATCNGGAIIRLQEPFSWFEGRTTVVGQSCLHGVVADATSSVISRSEIQASRNAVWVTGSKLLVRSTAVRGALEAGVRSGDGLLLGAGSVAKRVWLSGGGSPGTGIRMHALVVDAVATGYTVGLKTESGVAVNVITAGNISGVLSPWGDSTLLNSTIANNSERGVDIPFNGTLRAAANLLVMNNQKEGIYCGRGDRTGLRALSTTVIGYNGDLGFNCEGTQVDGRLVIADNAVGQCTGSLCSQFTIGPGRLGDGNFFVTPGMNPVGTPNSAINFFRGAGGDPFPSTIQHWGAFPAGDYPGTGRGACYTPDIATESGNCLLWDFTMKSGSPVLNINAAPRAPNSFLEHTWSVSASNDNDCAIRAPGSKFASVNTCVSRHLKFTYELVGDEVGNDNGLCESNETCVFSPNAGAYQGEGALGDAQVFSNSEFEKITLLRFARNGR